MEGRKIFSIIIVIILMIPLTVSLISPRGIKASSDCGDFEYQVDGQEITITNYTGSADIVEIPSNIDGKAVTKIGKEAFKRCSSLRYIIIPESITSISQEAFSYCKNLKEISIPDSVKNIGEKAFYYCEDMSEITLSKNIENIERETFYKCISLENIIIPKGVKSIENSAFRDCEKLKSIILPMGLTNIATSVFSNCQLLTNINLPKGLISIGGSAFSGCKALSSITIPESVIEIGGYAFSNCSSLREIIIPEGIGVLQLYVFEKCTSLNSIFIPESVTQIYNNAFENSSLSKIYGYQNSKAQKYAVENNLQFSIVYDIYFDTRDGQEPTRMTIEENNKVNKPEDPKRQGYIFQGWFKDEIFEDPWDFQSDTIEEETTLYAKWSKSHITTPQVQLLKETNEDSPSTSMRFLSTIENLDYSELGFVMSYSNPNPLIDGDGCIINSTRLAYEKIKAAGDYITADDLGGGKYIVMITLDDILNNVFSNDIYVKPYVKLLDGSIHYGNISIFSVEQCLEELDYK